MDIMNRLPVKSLLQFRAVSKQWKFSIDSFDFIRFSNFDSNLIVFSLKPVASSEGVGVGEFSPPYYISQLGDSLIISGSFDFGAFRIIYAWALDFKDDATHLKGQYKGTNLIAVGMDGNNQIVPIAFGICKGETVQDEFPLAYHVVCCRHLMMNLYLKRDKTKALFWRICKAYTTEEFSRSMSHLQDIQTDAYDKLCQVGPQRSSSAHCPLVNSVESVNACTVVYMKMPVLKLTETYRAMVQEWYYQRRKLTGTCQCRKWQLSGIPCGHVISVTGYLGLSDCQLFVSDWFKNQNIKIDISTVLIPNDGSLEEALSIVLMKLQEALDEKAIFKEHILTLMHRFADRFTEHTVEINNLMVLQDHPLIDY
nr:hypothetical protein [Tanacetum cinerariifolium]GEY39334.1 hypothetical protein [Tanacetum cinerariifolium]